MRLASALKSVHEADACSPPQVIKGTVNIQVGDVNDNAPRFHNQPYSVRIPEVGAAWHPRGAKRGETRLFWGVCGRTGPMGPQNSVSSRLPSLLLKQREFGVGSGSPWPEC